MMKELPEEEKVPVTILTGFLGAGKTTLLNHILTAEHGKKIAVIENEFGEVQIDQDLVGENMETKENVVSMDNGCVCCTVRGDLVRALAMLRKRGPFDAVIVETTGLADPAPVAFTFYTSMVVRCSYKIDAIITLVDAKHVQQHLHETPAEDAVNEAVQQVAFADKILLNKTDLVSPEELVEVREEIESINSYAEVMECQLAKNGVPLDKILGLGAYSVERSLEIDPEGADQSDEECEDEDCTDESHVHSHGHGHAHGEGVTDENCTDESHGHGAEKKEEHGHGHGHGEAKKEEHGHGHGGGHGHAEGVTDESCSDPSHAHGHGHAHGQKKKKKKKKVHDLSGVSSVGIVMDGEVSDIKFNHFMSTLLKEKNRDLYRSKGVLAFHGQSAKFVFQGVHEQINFGPAATGWAEGEKRICKLVFIGRKLDRAALEEGFRACAHKALPEGWIIAESPEGEPYYFNQKSGESSWDEPTADMANSADMATEEAAPAADA